MGEEERGQQAPKPGLLASGDVTDSLIMVVTQLNLEFRFQGKKLRGFSCELTRSPHGVFPETIFTTTCQVTVPILLSGLGMMAAGLMMNIVQVRPGHRRGSGDGVEGRNRVSWHHRWGRPGTQGPEPGLNAVEPSQWGWWKGLPSLSASKSQSNEDSGDCP